MDVATGFDIPTMNTSTIMMDLITLKGSHQETYKVILKAFEDGVPMESTEEAGAVGKLKAFYGPAGALVPVSLATKIRACFHRSEDYLEDMRETLDEVEEVLLGKTPRETGPTAYHEFK